MTTNVNYHAYDQAMKILEQKSSQGLIEAFFPDNHLVSEIKPLTKKIIVSNMKEVDFLVEAKINAQKTIVHIEFESAYKSNIKMSKRMHTYFAIIDEINDQNLPIYQLIVVLKKPKKIRNVKIERKNMNIDMIKTLCYNYGVNLNYEMHKNDVKKKKLETIYPFRIFMKYDEKTIEEHIKECLKVAEETENAIYYTLTVALIKKFYSNTKYESFVKGELLMKTLLYEMPFNDGKKVGKEEGITFGLAKGKEEGIKATLVATNIYLLGKKFGSLPNNIAREIEKQDIETLELIRNNIFEIESLNELEKYFNYQEA